MCHLYMSAETIGTAWHRYNVCVVIVLINYCSSYLVTEVSSILAPYTTETVRLCSHCAGRWSTRLRRWMITWQSPGSNRAMARVQLLSD